MCVCVNIQIEEKIILCQLVSYFLVSQSIIGQAEARTHKYTQRDGGVGPVSIPACLSAPRQEILSSPRLLSGHVTGNRGN